MNFLEFLQEEHNKELYVIINTETGDVPMENGKDPFKTWAISSAKAKWQIIYRLQQSPEKLSWKVLNNPAQYEAITWDKYIEIAPKKPAYVPPQPPTPPPPPKQLKLFDDPNITTPY